MTIRTLIRSAGLLTALSLLTASTASAQPRVEIGTSLAGAFIGLGDENDVTTVGVPSAGFGLVDSGVYASLFIGTRFAIEPRIGAVWFSADGESEHFVNISGQANYYVSGIEQPSLFLFGAAGILDSSGDGDSPKTVSGGVGYRVPVGDRLVFRFDGRFLRVMEDAGDDNQLLFSVSIGGLFGR